MTCRSGVSARSAMTAATDGTTTMEMPISDRDASNASALDTGCVPVALRHPADVTSNNAAAETVTITWISQTSMQMQRLSMESMQKACSRFTQMALVSLERSQHLQAPMTSMSHKAISSATVSAMATWLKASSAHQKTLRSTTASCASIRLMT